MANKTNNFGSIKNRYFFELSALSVTQMYTVIPLKYVLKIIQIHSYNKLTLLLFNVYYEKHKFVFNQIELLFWLTLFQ